MVKVVSRKLRNKLLATLLSAYMGLAGSQLFARQTSQTNKAKLNHLSLESTVSESYQNNRLWARAQLPLGIEYRSLSDIKYKQGRFEYFGKHILGKQLTGDISAVVAYYALPNKSDHPKAGIQVGLSKLPGVDKGVVQALYDLKKPDHYALAGRAVHKFGNRGHIGFLATTEPAQGKLYFEVEAAVKVDKGLYLIGQLCDGNRQDPVYRGGVKIDLLR